MPKMVLKMNTNSTEIEVSRRAGHVTFDISWRTCRTNRPGVVRAIVVFEPSFRHQQKTPLKPAFGPDERHFVKYIKELGCHGGWQG
jgi:hypothetical protein